MGALPGFDVKKADDLTIIITTTNALRLRPSSDAVLHMSRTEFDELNSCVVRRLNQFGTAD